MAAKQKSKPVAAKKPAAAAKESQTTNIFTQGFWREHWMPAVVLMAIAFALYAIGINYGYVLDDELTFWKNTYVQKGIKGLSEIFSTDSFMGYFKEQKYVLEGGRYRPLSLATFALEVEFFGPNHPAISHFINVLLYGFTGILLYRILAGLFPQQEGGRWFFSLAFIASALFMLHPLHVECVANIKGRDELLSLLGGLASLWATIKYFDTRKAWWLAVSALLLLLGMFAKENALTFVAVVPLAVACFTRVSVWRAVGASMPLVAAALIFLWVRHDALGYTLNHGRSSVDLMNNPFIGMTGSEKFATIFLTLGWYLKLLFVPYPLTIDYYPYHVPKVGWDDWRAMLGLGLNLALGVWALINVRKEKYRVPAFAILFYFITLSIVSNLFVSIGTFMNERFAYMPSVGFCLLAGWFFARKFPEILREQEDKPYPLGAILLGVTAAAFSYIVIDRIPDWRSGLTLNQSAVEVSTGSARSHSFYATGLYEEKLKGLKDKEERKRLVEEMEYHIKQSLEINPTYQAALIMKFNVAAARLELDNQLDKFFHVAEDVITVIPYNTTFRANLDAYLKYLDGSNADKYMAFCHRVGYDFFWKVKKDAPTALHFLEFGLNRQYEDIRILTDMAEIYGAMGETAKAAEMKARADAQK